MVVCDIFIINNPDDSRFSPSGEYFCIVPLSLISYVRLFFNPAFPLDKFSSKRKLQSDEYRKSLGIFIFVVNLRFIKTLMGFFLIFVLNTNINVNFRLLVNEQ